MEEATNLSSFDLYTDLIEDNVKQKEYSHSELEELYKKAKETITVLEQKLDEATTLASRLQGENTVLKKNISSLLVTAKTEIQRKDEEIKRLRNCLENRWRRQQHVHLRRRSSQHQLNGNEEHSLSVDNSSNTTEGQSFGIKLGFSKYGLGKEQQRTLDEKKDKAVPGPWQGSPSFHTKCKSSEDEKTEKRFKDGHVSKGAKGTEVNSYQKGHKKRESTSVSSDRDNPHGIKVVSERKEVKGRRNIQDSGRERRDRRRNYGGVESFSVRSQEKENRSHTSSPQCSNSRKRRHQSEKDSEKKRRKLPMSPSPNPVENDTSPRIYLHSSVSKSNHKLRNDAKAQSPVHVQSNAGNAKHWNRETSAATRDKITDRNANTGCNLNSQGLKSDNSGANHGVLTDERDKSQKRDILPMEKTRKSTKDLTASQDKEAKSDFAENERESVPTKELLLNDSAVHPQEIVSETSAKVQSHQNFSAKNDNDLDTRTLAVPLIMERKAWAANIAENIEHLHGKDNLVKVCTSSRLTEGKDCASNVQKDTATLLVSSSHSSVSVSSGDIIDEGGRVVHNTVKPDSAGSCSAHTLLCEFQWCSTVRENHGKTCTCSVRSTTFSESSSRVTTWVQGEEIVNGVKKFRLKPVSSNYSTSFSGKHLEPSTAIGICDSISVETKFEPERTGAVTAGGKSVSGGSQINLKSLTTFKTPNTSPSLDSIGEKVDVDAVQSCHKARDSRTTSQKEQLAVNEDKVGLKSEAESYLTNFIVSVRRPSDFNSEVSKEECATENSPLKNGVHKSPRPIEKENYSGIHCGMKANSKSWSNEELHSVEKPCPVKLRSPLCQERSSNPRLEIADVSESLMSIPDDVYVFIGEESPETSTVKTVSPREELFQTGYKENPRPDDGDCEQRESLGQTAAVSFKGNTSCSSLTVVQSPKACEIVEKGERSEGELSGEEEDRVSDTSGNEGFDGVEESLEEGEITSDSCEDEESPVLKDDSSKTRSSLPPHPLPVNDLRLILSSRSGRDNGTKRSRSRARESSRRKDEKRSSKVTSPQSRRAKRDKLEDRHSRIKQRGTSHARNRSEGKTMKGAHRLSSPTHRPECRERSPPSAHRGKDCATPQHRRQHASELDEKRGRERGRSSLSNCSAESLHDKNSSGKGPVSSRTCCFTSHGCGCKTLISYRDDQERKRHRSHESDSPRRHRGCIETSCSKECSHEETRCVSNGTRNRSLKQTRAEYPRRSSAEKGRRKLNARP